MKSAPLHTGHVWNAKTTANENGRNPTRCFCDTSSIWVDFRVYYSRTVWLVFNIFPRGLCRELRSTLPARDIRFEKVVCENSANGRFTPPIRNYCFKESRGPFDRNPPTSRAGARNIIYTPCRSRLLSSAGHRGAPLRNDTVVASSRHHTRAYPPTCLPSLPRWRPAKLRKRPRSCLPLETAVHRDCTHTGRTGKSANDSGRRTRGGFRTPAYENPLR